MHPRFLAAIDFSENSGKALTLAAQYTRRYGGVLHVVHCIYYHGNALAHEREDLFWEKATEEASAKMAETIATYAQGVENIQTQLVEGRPEDAILEFAGLVEPDMIFIGAQGFRLSGNPYIGSTTLSVLRKHRRPLFIVPQLPVFREGPLHLLAPVSRRYGIRGLLAFVKSVHFSLQVNVELLHLVTEEEDSDATTHFLTRKSKELEEAGVPHSTALVRLESDNIASGVSAHMLQSTAPFDGIVVESRDPATYGEMLVGGTLEDIILNCKRPVLCLNVDLPETYTQAQ